MLILSLLPSLPLHRPLSPSSKITPLSPPTKTTTNQSNDSALSRRKALSLLASSLALSSLIQVARADVDSQQEEEERVVRIFQEASPSVVFIKDLELQPKGARNKKLPPLAATTAVSPVIEEEEEEFRDAKVEGTGSGFVWDKAGHIVTNYHVIAKLATDQSGLQRCKVFFEDSYGSTFAREGKLVGYDPAYDLAVLKVDVERDKLRPALIGSSHDLRVGQSCFAIGNPYGYEHTLTTGVVSGVGREIPSPNGRPIRGAIQTDAAINAGTGISSGVNFAIPIDAVVRTVPYLIVYGTSNYDRF